MRLLTRRQALAGAAATGVAVLGGTAAVLASAGGGADPQAILVGILNDERRWNGLAPAIGNPALQEQAELQADRIAFYGTLDGMHLTAGQFAWWLHPSRGLHWLGEIIAGDAPAEQGLLGIDQQWIRSEPHRGILLDPRAALVGVGVREGHGRYWASAVFGG